MINVKLYISLIKIYNFKLYNLIKNCNYNGIFINLLIYFDFQYKKKSIIMLPLVGVMNIMKINQYKIH